MTQALQPYTAHLIVTGGGQPTGIVSSLGVAGALAWEPA
jgi:hypothetical protein